MPRMPLTRAKLESFPGSRLCPCPQLASETFVVPNPLVAGRKSRSHRDEQQNTGMLAILSEEKGASEQRVSPLRIKRNKLAEAERRLRSRQWSWPTLAQALQEQRGSSVTETRQHLWASRSSSPGCSKCCTLPR